MMTADRIPVGTGSCTAGGVDAVVDSFFQELEIFDEPRAVLLTGPSEGMAAWRRERFGRGYVLLDYREIKTRTCWPDGLPKPALDSKSLFVGDAVLERAIRYKMPILVPLPDCTHLEFSSVFLFFTGEGYCIEQYETRQGYPFCTPASEEMRPLDVRMALAHLLAWFERRLDEESPDENAGLTVRIPLARRFNKEFLHECRDIYRKLKDVEARTFAEWMEYLFRDSDRIGRIAGFRHIAGVLEFYSRLRRLNREQKKQAYGYLESLAESAGVAFWTGSWSLSDDRIEELRGLFSDRTAPGQIIN